MSKIFFNYNEQIKINFSVDINSPFTPNHFTVFKEGVYYELKFNRNTFIKLTYEYNDIFIKTTSKYGTSFSIGYKKDPKGYIVKKKDKRQIYFYNFSDEKDGCILNKKITFDKQVISDFLAIKTRTNSNNLNSEDDIQQDEKLYVPCRERTCSERIILASQLNSFFKENGLNYTAENTISHFDDFALERTEKEIEEMYQGNPSEDLLFDFVTFLQDVEMKIFENNLRAYLSLHKEYEALLENILDYYYDQLYITNGLSEKEINLINKNCLNKDNYAVFEKLIKCFLKYKEEQEKLSALNNYILNMPDNWFYINPDINFPVLTNHEKMIFEKAKKDFDKILLPVIETIFNTIEKINLIEKDLRPVFNLFATLKNKEETPVDFDEMLLFNPNEYRFLHTKKVKNIDTEKVFDSVINAARFYNLPPKGISRACNGKQKRCGKYHWSYV